MRKALARMMGLLPSLSGAMHNFGKPSKQGPRKKFVIARYHQHTTSMQNRSPQRRNTRKRNKVLAYR